MLGRLAKARVSNPSCGLLDLLGGSLKEPAESIKVKMPVSSLDKVPDAEVKLCDALKACEGATASWAMEPVNHDGLRCSVGDGDWLIARASLHEPVVSLQMEADDAGGTAAICAAVLPYLQPFGEDIDLTELEAVAKSN